MSDSDFNGKRDIDFSAEYAVTAQNGGYRFRFFCALCGGEYSTGFIASDSADLALAMAMKEARPHFNWCCRCGKWVCDYHYNMQEAFRTECAPLEADSEQLIYLMKDDENSNGNIPGNHTASPEPTETILTKTKKLKGKKP